MMINVHSYESMEHSTVRDYGSSFFCKGATSAACIARTPIQYLPKGNSHSAGRDCTHGGKPASFLREARRNHFFGGEPTFQAKALVPLFRELKEKGIHICLDSNGGIWNEEVEELLNLTDLVLLDIKEFDPARHRMLTERSNGQTLRTATWLEANNRPFWLRYVLVPGYSDFEEDIRRMGESLGGYRMIQRVEILPYHQLGVHKYEAMGLNYH